jgi:hypothetical protein
VFSGVLHAFYRLLQRLHIAYGLRNVALAAVYIFTGTGGCGAWTFGKSFGRVKCVLLDALLPDVHFTLHCSKRSVAPLFQGHYYFISALQSVQHFTLCIVFITSLSLVFFCSGSRSDVPRSTDEHSDRLHRPFVVRLRGRVEYIDE